MEEDLRAHLAANVPLAAHVADRIQWVVRESAPSLALHLIDAPPDWTLKGPSGLVQARVQLDAWAETFLAAKAIGLAAVAALPERGQVVGATKFLSCVVLDTDRDRFGDAPNILHRTRTDVRVSFRPA
jgi:hypothetical protein